MSSSVLAAIDSPMPAAASTRPWSSTILLIPSALPSGMSTPLMPAVLADTTKAMFSIARARLAMSLGVSSGLPTSLVQCRNTSAPRMPSARATSGYRISSEAMQASRPSGVSATGNTPSMP